jgi:hypothetical protein
MEGETQPQNQRLEGQIRRQAERQEQKGSGVKWNDCSSARLFHAPFFDSNYTASFWFVHLPFAPIMASFRGSITLVTR